MNNLLSPALAPESTTPVRALQAWHAYRNGPTAATSEDEFLKAHLPLVRRVIDRMKASLPAHVEAEDLGSVGVIGLVQAARSYRADQGTAFSTYATLRIRGAVLDELRRMDWMPRRARAKAKELKETVNQLEQRLGRVATDSEVAEVLSLSAEEYAELLDEVRPITCLELDGLASEEDDETTLHELIGDDGQTSASAQMEHTELLAQMAARIQQLPEMQRKVLALYYFEEMRLAEIARIFGVTESRICQIHTQAIVGLRAYLKSAQER
ncbi:MAG: polymerase sigma factor FliA [Chthoniobacter sp.]|jgi:RNA polymerase sigma factor for flagellar operon FliA|nr:polymerase sigma factor FliA [Chthoniobacter sp.]